MTAWQQGEPNRKLPAIDQPVWAHDTSLMLPQFVQGYTHLLFSMSAVTIHLHRVPPYRHNSYSSSSNNTNHIHPFSSKSIHLQWISYTTEEERGGRMLPGTVYVCILEVVEMQSDGLPYIHNYVSLPFCLQHLISLSIQIQNKMMLPWIFFFFFLPPVIGQTSQERTLKFVFWAFFPFCLPVSTWCHCTHLHTGSDQLLEVKKAWEHAILPPLWNGFVISKIVHESLLFGGTILLKLVARMQVVWFWNATVYEYLQMMITGRVCGQCSHDNVIRSTCIPHYVHSLHNVICH